MPEETVVTKYYLDHVVAVVKDATDEVTKQLAFRIMERAQLNIRENDQIDTGLMVNSVYPIWKNGSGFTEAESAALSQTHSSKTGRVVDHTGDMAPEEPLPSDAGAGVVVGAVYAICQENIKPFLYPAAEAASAEFGGEAEKIMREQLPDEGPLS